MAQLNVNEAQRKAMLEWMGEVDPDDFDYEEWLDGLFAAANSIPEGAPVGTIARRPDGAWIGVRREDYWAYRNLVGLSHDVAELSGGPSVAESWPVIFAPNEVGSSEHSVSDGDAYDPTKPIGPEIWRLAEWLEEHDDGEPYEIYTPDGSYGYRLSASQVGRHPTAQQEPEECPCAPGSGHCVTTAVPKPPRTPRVVDRLGVDEQGSRWLDRVGDEWWYTVLSRWRYRSHIDGGAGAGNPLDMYAPYVEILEPRVLPSLDCEEARDGTVWKAAFSETEHRRGWKFWYVAVEREWHTDSGHGRNELLGPQEFLTDRGPYTEVLS